MKYYKCSVCGYEFCSDEENYVVCPSCQTEINEWLNQGVCEENLEL